MCSELYFGKSDRKMQTAPSVLSLFLIVLSYSGWTNGLCDLENGTAARCTELKDAKYIETYDLETLKAPAVEVDLHPGLFDNLTTLRHLDLSGGDLQRLQPGVFEKLTNLRSLNLAENELESLDAGVIRGLNHLHSLNLRRNNLRELPPGIVEVKSLRHLDVQGNPLQCNCATLLVRDLITKQGVKISKKTVCAGPKHIKGTSLFKPDAAITCNLEEQDHEMQNDDPIDESEQEYGSGTNDKEDIEEEFVNILETSPEPTKAPEIETPAPEAACLPGDAECPVHTSQEEEIFVDSTEKKEDPVTPGMGRKKVYKDALFSPIEGSGDDDDGSGEGSGTGTIFDGWGKVDGPVETTHSEEETQSIGDKLLSTFFNVFLSTSELPETKKDLDLEEEQFIVASTSKADEKVVVTKKITEDESAPVTASSSTETVQNITTISVHTNVEVFDGELPDLSKASNVKAEEDEENDKLAEVSAAKQSKKGIGSYVVLAALLAILATLIVFAAYKGDFCKKKRKRGDVESGTEMKDMQKSLLDTGNSTQPKVITNGNVENVPLVEDTADHEETRTSSDHQNAISAPRSLNGTSERIDPVKPPRRSNGRSSPDANSLKNDSPSARTSPVDVTVSNVPLLPANGPPLSPGAQRVKITLQENPDSVPKTPILITRTMAGENLVKTP
nr:protein windpipe isoform X1 [Nomia melanderi]